MSAETAGEASTNPSGRPRAGDGRERPTEPSDYAALNAVYGALLAALVLATRNQKDQDPAGGAELLSMGAATFALSKLIARERIGTWVREPFVERRDSHGERPRGRGLQRAMGELVTCTRCVGAWSGLAIVGLRVASPQAGRTVTAVLASSAANDFLQAGFRWACAKSNQANG